jgi:hypothetical protein
MWALQVLKHEIDDDDNPVRWREQLSQARAIDAAIDDDRLESHNGPGIVAAVCVRDHWIEMSTEEQEWCVEKVCVEILKTSDNWNDNVRIQRFPPINS